MVDEFDWNDPKNWDGVCHMCDDPLKEGERVKIVLEVGGSEHTGIVIAHRCCAEDRMPELFFDLTGDGRPLPRGDSPLGPKDWIWKGIGPTEEKEESYIEEQDRWEQELEEEANGPEETTWETDRL